MRTVQTQACCTPASRELEARRWNTTELQLNRCSAQAPCDSDVVHAVSLHLAPLPFGLESTTTDKDIACYAHTHNV